MADRGRPPKPPFSLGAGVDSRPTWTVTRRERTELSPLRTGTPYQSRTVTTTERVQIMQLPIDLTEQQIAPARLLAFSPTANTSQSVSSTVTTIQGEGTPLIGAMTADGVPLFNGILHQPEARHTTTIITTTTTTYRVVEVSDSDSQSDDFDMLEEALADNTLTIDLTMVPRSPSPQYVIVSKAETETPLTPVSRTRMEIDLWEAEIKEPRFKKSEEFQAQPIMELVSVYHCGASVQDSDHLPEESFPRVTSEQIFAEDQEASTSQGDVISLADRDELQSTESGDSFEQVANQDKTTETKHRATAEKNDFEILSLFKQGPAHLDYPTSEIYHGPLDITEWQNDIDSQPLTQYSATYHHSGTSVTRTVHKVEAPTKQSRKTNISGPFKRGPAHLDYPTSEIYEGPLDNTGRHHDIDGQPLTEHVEVYHVGHSYEPTPVVVAKIEEPVHEVEIEKEATEKSKGFGFKLPGLFRKGHAHQDYPSSEIYEGPLDNTGRHLDIDGQPLSTMVTVYHSGRSDEPSAAVKTEKPDEPEFDIADAARGFGSKISGLFKRGPAHLDYPTSEIYEGPLDNTGRHHDIDGQPLTEHVEVYHVGHSYEPTPVVVAKIEEPVHEVEIEKEATEKSKGFGFKLPGLFRKGHAHQDYPSSEIYEGPLDNTGRHLDIDGQPLSTMVTVYHSGRSDEPSAAVKTEKPDEPEFDIADAARGFGSKISGLFKRGPAHLDYPTSEIYEGPLDNTGRHHDIDGQPLTEHVEVYHVGHSYEPTPVVVAKIEEPVHEVEIEKEATEKSKGFGFKLPGLFRKGHAHQDYPSSEIYEGPLDNTGRHLDIDGQPLSTMVTVYHSGRSDEPSAAVKTEKPDEPEFDIADAARGFGSKISGLFKRGPAHLDYPTSEIYEGPLDNTGRHHDIDGQPLTEHVEVYHVGHSYEPTPVVVAKIEEPVHEVEIEKEATEKSKGFGFKLPGLFRKGHAHQDYPSSEIYEGPLDNTGRHLDIDGQPLSTMVTVYHSGRSDEPSAAVKTEKPDEPEFDIADAARGFGSKISGLFKRGPAHLDYPTSEIYEGPLDNTGRHHDIDGQPLTEHVEVYHVGHSYEPTPVVVAKIEEPVHEVEIEKEATEKSKGFGFKLPGLFRKGHAHQDYPSSEIYEGPLDNTGRHLDIDGQPLSTMVTVYHSGRSDEPSAAVKTEKPDEPEFDIADAARGFGSKISGLFKRGPAHLDYPTSEIYEGPLDNTGRHHDIDGQPLTEHVEVYHVGHSYEPTPVVVAKIEEPVHEVEIEKEATEKSKGFGFKLPGLFRKGHAHQDYPSSEIYEGPLDNTGRHLDIDGQPLSTMVTVYHSGRSDEPSAAVKTEKPDEPEFDIADAARGFGSKISGLFKRGPAHLDYPTSEIYEGPLDNTGRHHDIDGQPLTEHVEVYHVGHSYEPTPVVVAKIEEPVHEVEIEKEATEKSKGFGFKLPGLFRKGHAHQDYPSSEIYEGPLDNTGRHLDIDGQPLSTMVTVYHSGRSDEPSAAVKTEKPDEPEFDIADAARGFGSKISGLFKRGPAHLDYPTSEIYEGPLDNTGRHHDIDGQPLTEHVEVYHVGHSYEPTPVVVAKIEEPVHEVEIEKEATEKSKGFGFKLPGLFRKGHAHQDYPSSEIYEGPLDNTGRHLDIDGQPLSTMVTVYHSGRSDEPSAAVKTEKPDEPEFDIADAARGFGSKISGLFKRGPAHLDYPTSEIYEGPLDNTGRHHDIDGQPLTEHVEVYHVGHSYEPTPVVVAKIEEPVHEVEIEKEATEKSKGFGFKLPGLFRKGHAHQDYPSSEIYEGPLDNTGRHLDIDGQPLSTMVTVYHSGRSDEPSAAVKTEKPDEPEFDIADAARGFGSKISGLFKRGPAHLDYPTSEIYEGPLDNTGRHHDIDGQPLTEHVEVYHVGHSYEPTPVVVAKIEEPVHEVEIEKEATEKSKGFGFKLPGLFRKGHAHQDYPSSEIYEGPLDNTGRHLDIDGQPLSTMVTVYHSGRSDEPSAAVKTEKPDEPEFDIADAARGFGSKISGLFKRGPAHLDYPTSEIYEGPLDNTGRHHDIDGQPLTEHVEVYHVGHSYEPTPVVVAKIEEPVHEVEIEKEATEKSKGFGFKLPGLFRKGHAHQDYPSSEIYEGPLDNTGRHLDIDGQPLSTMVTVYHSGRSDEPSAAVKTEKPDEPEFDIADAARGFGSKISGLFKRGPAHLDYPTSEIYEGPLDNTGRHHDIDGQPLTEHVEVYHVGHSYEPTPVVVAKIEEPVHEVEIEKEATEKSKGFGFKLPGLFRKGHAHQDYPSSEIYEGPLDNTGRHLDIDGQPLSTMVTVYHSGRSDEPSAAVKTEKPDEPEFDIADAARGFGSKISGLFKRGPAHLDYPTSEIYEGPLDNTGRHHDIDGQPLTEHVEVYHVGHSYEPTPVVVAKIEEPVHEVEIEKEATEKSKGFGFKLPGLFRKGHAHQDYPSSEIYEGPLDNTGRHLDIDGQPLSTMVTVYHSGRSDEPSAAVKTEKPDEPEFDIADAARGFGSKISGLFKRGPAHLDYPTSEIYEGPLDNTGRHHDIDGQPLTEHVEVYHVGHSYEPTPVVVAKIEEPVHEVEIEKEATEKSKGFGFKLPGLFRKGHAHQDYPSSEIYEGPLDNTGRHLDIDGQPLSTMVTVYHSGRSDEPSAAVKTEKPDEPEFDIADAARGFGSKISGLFKRGPAHLDYPTSEIYEGPLDNTGRHHDIDGQPLTEHVEVYHVGHSYEPTPVVVAKIEEPVHEVEIEKEATEKSKGFGFKLPGLFRKGHAHQDYPSSEIYEGPLDNTGRHLDIDGQPLSTMVTVYHSGRSDEPSAAVKTEKPDEPEFDIADAARGFGSKISGLFKRGPAHLDYPTSEIYEGPLDNTGRHHDIDGQPLTEHVEVYHVGHSYEPTPVVVAKIEEPVHEVEIEKEATEKSKGFGFKLPGLFRKGHAHQDYPSSEIYEGPLDNTGRHLDIDGQPLSTMVTVYHSGRSDEPSAAVKTEKPDEPEFDIADAARGFGSKISGLFKRGPAHLDYPTSEIYEGPLDNTGRHHDIDGQPLTEHVEVYHVGHSYEPTPVVVAKIEEPVHEVEIEKEATEKSKGFGFKLPGLFRKGHAHQDYPSSEIYEGPLDNTGRHLDIDGQPLSTMVTVYHSGRSDEPSAAVKTEKPKDFGVYPAELKKQEENQYASIGDDSSLLTSADVHKVDADIITKDLRVQISSAFDSTHMFAYQGRSEASTEWKGRSLDFNAEDSKVNFDVQFLVRDSHQEPEQAPSMVLSADHLVKGQKSPLGFSVSISAKQPQRSRSDQHEASRSERAYGYRPRQLSPHSWTTIHERTEISYIKRVTVSQSQSPVRYVTRSTKSPTEMRAYSHSPRPTTCRLPLSDERLNVHHPIYAPRESPYRPSPQERRRENGYHGATNGHVNGFSPTRNVESNGITSINGHATTRPRTFSPVREVAAIERTEWLRRSDYIPPNRRSDEIFTLGVPFVMGTVERDEHGCEYLRYQNSGLHEVRKNQYETQRNDLPMIEEGAIECRRSTIRSRLRETDLHDLIDDNDEIERRRRPIRRARQRARNYCTML